MIGKNEPQLFPWKIENDTAALHISVYMYWNHSLTIFSYEITSLVRVRTWENVTDWRRIILVGKSFTRCKIKCLVALAIFPPGVNLRQKIMGFIVITYNSITSWLVFPSIQIKIKMSQRFFNSEKVNFLSQDTRAIRFWNVLPEITNVTMNDMNNFGIRFWKPIWITVLTKNGTCWI